MKSGYQVRLETYSGEVMNIHLINKEAVRLFIEELPNRCQLRLRCLGYWWLSNGEKRIMKSIIASIVICSAIVSFDILTDPIYSNCKQTIEGRTCDLVGYKWKP